MVYKDAQGLIDALMGISVKGEAVSIKDKKLVVKDTDLLVEQMILSDDEEVRSLSYWIVWNAAQSLGTYPSSIQSFYEARGRGEVSG